MPTVNLRSVVNDQGTAMTEATLCLDHYADIVCRDFAEGVAVDADDLTGPIQWRDSTGNEAVRCVECPNDDWTA